MAKLTPARKRVLLLLAQGGTLRWRVAENSFFLYYQQVGGKERVRESMVMELQHDGWINDRYAITAQGRDAVAQGAA